MSFNHVAILLTLLALPLHAAPVELTPEKVRNDLGSAIGEIAVIEPNAQCGKRDCIVTYVGVPLRTLIEYYFRDAWQGFSGEIHFIAGDGYLGIVEAARAREKDAYLVFARADGAPFIVANNQQNERAVPLGPFYLVWDNLEDPDLQQMGSYGWPYQVTRIQLVSETVYSKLMSPDASPAAQAGFASFKTYCLGCHHINGVGGRKVGVDMKLLVYGKSRDALRSWISDPRKLRPASAMPPLNTQLDRHERERIIDQIVEFLVVR
jgi:mono/diheme cytochrome c family protein